MRSYVPLFSALLVFLSGCTKETPTGIVPNSPPETHIFIKSDTLSPVLYQQEVHWWGDDIDGYVVGYYYTWIKEGSTDTLWTWTIKQSEKFPDARYPLPVGNQTEIYYFIVKGVDNTATFSGTPGDSTAPISILGAVDPTPAVQRFPLFNNRPFVTLKFVTGQGPGTKIVVPDTSFPVATFKWKAIDPDVGDFVSSVEIRGDWEPADVWHGPYPAESLYTFHNIPVNGNTPTSRAVRVRAFDGGGASSIYVTQSQSDTFKTGPYAGSWNVHSWTVKPAQGTILLVDDWDEIEGGEGDDGFYRIVMEKFYPQQYSIWNINYTVNGTIKRSGLYTFEADTREVFSKFSTIVWYTNYSKTSPNLTEARRVLVDFLLRSANPGNLVVISSSMFGKSAKNFSFPADSVLIRDIFHISLLPFSQTDMQIPDNVPINGVGSTFGADTLQTEIFISGADGMVTTGNAEAVFRGQDIFGTPGVLGIRYMGTEPGKPYKFYILTFPLNKTNLKGNADLILKKIVDSF